MRKKQLKIRLHHNKHKDLKMLAVEKEVSINFIVELAISMVIAHPEKIIKKGEEDDCN